MLVAVLLLIGLVFVLSRIRRDRRAREQAAAVLTSDDPPQPSCARRAEAALADGRHADAVVDAFRALAVRQVERGRLADQPGTTAHEVATTLASAYPDHRERVGRGADLFDATYYGDHPASRDGRLGSPRARRQPGRCSMRWIARHRVAVLIGAAVVVAVVLSAWVGRDRARTPRPSTRRTRTGRRSGARPRARRPGRRGGRRPVGRGSGPAAADSSTTIVVTSTGDLGRSTTHRLLRHQGGADLVVVAPVPSWCASSASAPSRSRPSPPTRCPPRARRTPT